MSGTLVMRGGPGDIPDSKHVWKYAQPYVQRTPRSRSADLERRSATSASVEVKLEHAIVARGEGGGERARELARSAGEQAGARDVGGDRAPPRAGARAGVRRRRRCSSRRNPRRARRRPRRHEDGAGSGLSATSPPPPTPSRRSSHPPSHPATAPSPPRARPTAARRAAGEPPERIEPCAPPLHGARPPRSSRHQESQLAADGRASSPDQCPWTTHLYSSRGRRTLPRIGRDTRPPPPRRLMGAAEQWPESPVVGETPSECPEHGRALYRSCSRYPGAPRRLPRAREAMGTRAIRSDGPYSSRGEEDLRRTG